MRQAAKAADKDPRRLELLLHDFLVVDVSEPFSETGARTFDIQKANASGLANDQPFQSLDSRDRRTQNSEHDKLSS
jgi:hypothetical protein